MNVEDARVIKDEALSNYRELAKLVYLPIVEKCIRRAAGKGASTVDVKLGGGFTSKTPVPEIKVVDEVIRILESEGFVAKYTHEMDPIIMAHEKVYGREITVEW